jgi:hypothetical protein
MKSEQYKKEEEAISKAIEAYELDKNQKIVPLARQFGAPYDRLRKRIAGVNSRITRAPAGKRLTDDQESTLMAWIKHIDDTRAPPTVNLVIKLRKFDLVAHKP